MPIKEGNRELTPADYLKMLRDTQGDRPVAWARSLAALIQFNVVSETEAQPYAEELAKSLSDRADDFWIQYNRLLLKKDSKDQVVG